MRVDQVATVRNEQDGRPRTRRDERSKFARNAVAEHGGREFVDFAADDEGVGGIDKRSGLQGGKMRDNPDQSTVQRRTAQGQLKQ